MERAAEPLQGAREYLHLKVGGLLRTIYRLSVCAL
jgi:hypothetical protein